MSTIKTLLIDDNKEFLTSLKEYLAKYHEIEIIGEANGYKKAKAMWLNKKPDLVFLDIEMPVKNGFELFEEIVSEINLTSKVVFVTAYDKYMIEALRKAAFDFLTKPIDENELADLITRYKKSAMVTPLPIKQSLHEMIALPVLTGLRFIAKDQIILIECTNKFTKPNWQALLSTNETLRLKSNITAKDILHFLGENGFIQVNKSTIVNKNYISVIEYKTHKCFLTPPFNQIDITISRYQLAELKRRFDLM